MVSCLVGLLSINTASLSTEKESERVSLFFVNTNINIYTTERNKLWFSPLEVRDDWIIISQKNVIMIDDRQCLMFYVTRSKYFLCFWPVSLYTQSQLLVIEEVSYVFF